MAIKILDLEAENQAAQQGTTPRGPSPNPVHTMGPPLGSGQPIGGATVGQLNIAKASAQGLDVSELMSLKKYIETLIRQKLPQPVVSRGPTPMGVNPPDPDDDDDNLDPDDDGNDTGPIDLDGTDPW